MPREYPEYPIVGVGAVVLRDNKILLVKRGYPPGKGKWSIPGGVPEVGESLKDAVLRELYEETGIEGRVKGVVFVGEYIERDENGRVRYHYVLVDFLVEPVGGRLRASTDAVDVGFFELSEALKLELTSSTRKLVEKLSRSKPVLLPLL